MAVPIKLPEKLGVELLLKMQQLELCLQAFFGISPQSRARGPNADCLLSCVWGPQSGFCRLLCGFSLTNLSALDLGSFWSGPPGLPLLHTIYIVCPPLLSDVVTYRESLAILLV